MLAEVRQTLSDGLHAEPWEPVSSGEAAQPRSGYIEKSIIPHNGVLLHGRDEGSTDCDISRGTQ
jgi:hypothetical protein